MIEFSSIAAGTFAADAMAKEAELSLLRTGTVQRGNYVVLIGGNTAEVELCFNAGILHGSPKIVDDVFLPDVDRQVLKALEGKRQNTLCDTMAVLETSTLPAIVRATDAAVKGAQVTLKELRLADGLGGKGLAHLTGERADVEAAVELAEAVLAGRESRLCRSVISRIDADLAANIGKSTRFNIHNKGEI